MLPVAPTLRRVNVIAFVHPAVEPSAYTFKRSGSGNGTVLIAGSSTDVSRAARNVACPLVSYYRYGVVVWIARRLQ